MFSDCAFGIFKLFLVVHTSDQGHVIRSHRVQLIYIDENLKNVNKLVRKCDTWEN
jgi:hypothetical protein